MEGTSRQRPDSVTIIAIYHFMEAALFLLGLLAVAIGFVAVIVGARGEYGVGISLVVLGATAFVLLAIAAADVAAGVGLLYRKGWARWVAIVLSALRLPGVPVGTAVGGLTIYFLLRDDVKAAFENQ